MINETLMINISNITIPSVTWGPEAWLSYCGYVSSLAQAKAAQDTYGLFILGVFLGILFSLSLVVLLRRKVLRSV